MIRCNKCGFSNNDSVDTCIKCRSALVKEEFTIKREPVSINKKTIQVMNDDQEPWDQPSIIQPRRSFINTAKPVDRPAFKAGKDSAFSNPGKDLDTPQERVDITEDTFILSEIEKQENDEIPKSESVPFKSGAPTVRRVVPDRPESSYLVAISLDEEKELRKINLPGKEVLLDRGLLDPSNASISRNGHANIYLKDGSWYIENKTDLKTTFVQVNEPVKLKDGDVILMGDSLFKFKQS